MSIAIYIWLQSDAVSLTKHSLCRILVLLPFTTKPQLFVLYLDRSVFYFIILIKVYLKGTQPEGKRVAYPPTIEPSIQSSRLSHLQYFTKSSQNSPVPTTTLGLRDKLGAENMSCVFAGSHSFYLYIDPWLYSQKCLIQASSTPKDMTVPVPKLVCSDVSSANYESILSLQFVWLS